MTETAVSMVVSLVALYMAVITYRLSPIMIVGVNVAVGGILALIHHYTLMSTMTAITSIPGLFDEMLVFLGLMVASMVISFIIAMKRFTFLESVGIFVAGSVAGMILNTVLAIIWRTTPPPPQQPQQRQRL